MVLNFSSKYQDELMTFILKKKKGCSYLSIPKTSGKYDQPTSIEHSSAQIMVSKYYFPLKGVLKEIADSIWGKKCTQ